MKQVTMVSLYGQKDKKLKRLIEDCWEKINASKFRRIFKPYDMEQIHGTIIGMGKLIGFSELYNANIWHDLEDRRIMDFNDLVDIVKGYLPMTVRFGGFNENYDKFTSLGKIPYERSFQVQWKTSRFTLIGWPHKNGNFTDKKILLELRNEIEKKCNIRHKYARYNDNDLYMVLGEIKWLHLLTNSKLQELKMKSALLEESIREYLRKNYTDVKITDEQVFLAQLEKETLPLDSTNVYYIQDPRINNSFIQNLYS